MYSFSSLFYVSFQRWIPKKDNDTLVASNYPILRRTLLNFLKQQLSIVSYSPCTSTGNTSITQSSLEIKLCVQTCRTRNHCGISASIMEKFEREEHSSLFLLFVNVSMKEHDRRIWNSTIHLLYKILRTSKGWPFHQLESLVPNRPLSRKKMSAISIARWNSLS